MGGWISADEHGEPVVEVLNEDRIVERVDDVVVSDAVFASAGAMSGASTFTS